MRSIAGQDLVRDTNVSEFPYGTIQDKTDVQEGTPVSRLIYGDIHTNLYKLLERNGITLNEQEDSETNGYQLVEALAKHFNELNDLMQLITVSGSNLNSALNFDNLPTGYLFIGKVTESLTVQSYTLNSAGSNSFTANVLQPVSANGIVLIYLNGNSSSIIALENTFDSTRVNTSFGTPLSYNESATMYYRSGGIIFTETPASYDVQSIIRTFKSDGTIEVIDAIVHKGKLLVLGSKNDLTSSDRYSFYAFDLSNLSVVEDEITLPLPALQTDRVPYLYCDGTHLYFTNSDTIISNTANDYSLGQFLFDESALTITHVSTITLNTNFVKTTNVFLNTSSQLYTFIDSVITRYELSGATETVLNTFNTINGIVFKFNGKTYYSNGNTAIQWNY